MSVIVSVQTGAIEEGYDIPVTVTLSAPSSEMVSLLWTTLVSGSATHGDDFDEDYGTIPIAPGQITGAILLDTTGYYDNEVEADEFIEVEFYSLVNGTFDNGELWQHGIGWILDYDGTNLKRAIGVTNPVVVEDDSGQRYATFTISLSRVLDRDIQLSYATRDGSALAGQDYTATSGQVSFLAGQTTATVRVLITDNMIPEGREEFDLVVTPTSDFNAAGFGHIGTATIIDNDTGDARPTLSVEALNAQEGDDIWFGVRLSAPSSETVTVQYRTGSGSATVSDDYSQFDTTQTLTFAPGQTIRYVAVGTNGYYDNEIELDETVTLDLFNPFNAALTGGVATLTQAAWILDEDGLTQKRAVTVIGADIREPGPGETAQVVFTIELSRPSSETLSFNFQTANGTATAGLDYLARSGTVTFAPGQTSQQVAVTITGDTSIEALETVFLRLLSPFPAVVGSGAATAIGTVRIQDGAIVGSDFPDFRGGTARADAIFGRGGNDNLQAGAGNDFINGGLGSDDLFGGTGNDTVLGDKGNDDLFGGAGADRMSGGKGKDSLSGGVDAERDVFVFGNGHAGTGQKRDTINSFDSGEDEIDLRGIDANRGRVGDQDFGTFLGRKGDSFGQAHAVWVIDAGDDLILRGDVNGDRRADFEIRLTDLEALRGGDLLL